MVLNILSPFAVVHDVTLFLLNPPHPDAPQRQVWERARDTIAKLASDPAALFTTPSPPSNVIDLQSRALRRFATSEKRK